jgi:CheY-like chemotaxis protein
MADVIEVLVVEDDDDFRRALAAVLEVQGYRVVQAADKDETRARLRAHVPDVVVLDLGIPGPIGAAKPHGLDLAEEVKTQAIPTPTIIAFSGYHRLRIAARAAGCDHFVLKPEIDSLLTAIATATMAREEHPVRARKLS